METIEVGLAQEISGLRKSYRSVYYQIQKIWKPRPLRPIRCYDG